LCFVLLLQNSIVYAQTTELALFEQIPFVITPSKKLQLVTESPAPVYIVTKERIEENPTIHLYDALREVPGLDIVNSTIGQADVSMRGFSDMGTNKTLVLVDGRSIYYPLQGIELWEFIPVQLEEVERVEVVKGPVASLYGANANLGLINIITKNPKNIEGGIMSVSRGTQDTGRYSFVYGKSHDQLAYRVSTGWKDTNAFKGSPNKDALDMVQGNTYVEYQLSDDSKVSVGAGLSQGTVSYALSPILASENAFIGPLTGTSSYVKTDYEAGYFKSRIYWNFFDSRWQTGKFTKNFISNSVDMESKFDLDLTENDAFTIGGGGHFDYAKTDVFTQSDEQSNGQTMWNGFIQNDHKFSDQWSLNTSARVDHYPLSGFLPSWRVATLFHPSQEDLYRFSVGYSFRNPTLSEYYVNLPVEITGFAPLTASFIGNRELHPEIYTTYEIDYEGRKMDGRLRPFVSIYLTEIRGLIETVPTGGGPLGLDQQFQNVGEAHSIGGELGVDYDINSWLSLMESYSINHIDYDSVAIVKHFSPKQKIISGLRMKFFNNRLVTRLSARYVSATETTLGNLPKVPNYVLADAYVGFDIKENVNISIAGHNILNDRHQEIAAGDEVGSSVLGKLQVGF
jgi:iron complex outermembrane receptor protein